MMMMMVMKNDDEFDNDDYNDNYDYYGDILSTMCLSLV